jgi:hypothetical protein
MGNGTDLKELPVDPRDPLQKESQMRNNARIWTTLVTATSFAVLLPQSPGMAQTQPRDRCAAPSPRSPAGERDPQALVEKLDECNGELKAPPVGDGAIVEPAPDTGNTRVIKPGQLPGGANQTND